MDFSKYKFQHHLTEGQAMSAGAQGALDGETTSAEKSAEKALGRADRKSLTDRSQGDRMSQKSNRSKSGTSFPESREYFKSLRGEKEFIRMLESNRVDWRQELQEKVVDGQEREQHPYITVMPTGDENLLQAMTQMVKTARKKKDAVSEAVDLSEGKKCKDGYTYDSDEKKCVKKKKKKSSTTYIVGPRYGFGYGHHHHDDDDGDNGDDGDGGGGGDGGGMGEMFDLLGDMLFNEMSGTDAIKNVMAKSGKDKEENVETIEADTKAKNKMKYEKKVEKKRSNK